MSLRINLPRSFSPKSKGQKTIHYARAAFSSFVSQQAQRMPSTGVNGQSQHSVVLNILKHIDHHAAHAKSVHIGYGSFRNYRGQIQQMFPAWVRDDLQPLQASVNKSHCIAFYVRAVFANLLHLKLKRCDRIIQARSRNCSDSRVASALNSSLLTRLTISYPYCYQYRSDGANRLYPRWCLAIGFSEPSSNCRPDAKQRPDSHSNDAHAPYEHRLFKRIGIAHVYLPVSSASGSMLPEAHI